MKLGRSQRLLVFAFALSLLLHALVAYVLHQPHATQPQDVEAVTIEHRSAIMRLHTPPPPPKATPPPAHPQPSKRPAPVATQAANGTSGRGKKPAPTPVPTPAPTPALAVSAAPCAKSDTPAAVVGDAPQPDVPNAARADGTSGTASIDVKLDAQGAVLGAAVARGTGNSSLDLVAVAMARGARYAPALHLCHPVAATYTFSVKFVAW